MNFEKLFLALSCVKNKVFYDDISTQILLSYFYIFMHTFYQLFYAQIILLVWSSKAVVQMCSIKTCSLKFHNIHRKNTCVGVSLLIKLYKSLLKKIFQHECFPGNFEKIFWAPFLQTVPWEYFKLVIIFSQIAFSLNNLSNNFFLQ